MKVVFLAGGFGTRISEESHLRPKPMIEIGGKPILWHIMKHYASHGFNEFIICAGYKAYFIKEYFADYFLHNSDITFDFCNGENMMHVHTNKTEPWKVTIVDTGLHTMTGGRVKKIQPYLDKDPFFLTYGDGVSNVNIQEQLNYHKSHGRKATITTVNVGQRFGVLDIEDNGRISDFREKSTDDGAVINGGFMILDPSVLNYIQDDNTILEREPLEQLAQDGQLMAYHHSGFWQCMDTQRDKENLEKMWADKNAPWKTW